ncbi:hypothetical protein DRQ50_14555, partial [bacterium]
VYSAEHILLGRTDALKFLAPELLEKKEAVERFLREARMMAGLAHGNICNVYDIGQDDDETWYIAMAYYEGGTLKQKLADGPLDTPTALRYAYETALGLGHAHDHDIVHRDIKPANILFTNDDRVKIVDFGVARLLGGTRHTLDGAVVGTYGYLAPEQVRSGDVTAAADIWSLGIMLFEMLAGSLPFRGDTRGAQIYAIAHSEPLTLPLVNKELDRRCAAIIDRCLQKDPADRYPSAHHLAAAIHQVLATEYTTEFLPPPPVGSDDDSPPRRKHWWNRIRLQSAVVASVAALAFLGWTCIPDWLGPKYDRTGVAVLPFSFMGATDEDAALGHGLAWYVADRLAVHEEESDKYWVVPPGAFQLYDVENVEEVKDRFNTYRIVTGLGRVMGSNINLKVTISDVRSGKRVEKEFQDTVANLKTWQQDIVTWVAGVLSERQAVIPPEIVSRGGTSVPSAFIDYCRGVGFLYPDLGGDGPQQERARVALSRAVAADSSFAWARTELAYLNWDLDWPEDAEGAAAGREELQRTAAMEPVLSRSHYYLARVLQAEGDLDGALAAFEQGLTRDRNNAMIIRAYGNALIRARRKDDAIALFERLVAARPGYPPGYEMLSMAYYYFDEAEVAEGILREALEFAPRNYEGQYYLGVFIWKAREDSPEIEERFLESLAIKETSMAYSNLGTYYYYEQRYEDALLMYRRAVAHEPDSGRFWRNLAEAYRWSLGYADSARVAYEKAVRFAEADLAETPADPGVLTQLASFHSRLGHRDRTLELLATIEGLAERPPGGMAVTIADSYEELGMRDEALAWLEYALETDAPQQLIEDYPAFRNLRSDQRYRDMIERER